MDWWIYVLLGIYILICVVLVTAVLLQPGKSDAAALFGGGASQTAFGPRGTMNILGWTTWVAAGIMMVLALFFSVPQFFGPSSVIQGGQAPTPVEQPAQTTPEQPAKEEPAQPAGESSGEESEPAGQPNPAGTEPGSGGASEPNRD